MYIIIVAVYYLTYFSLLWDQNFHLCPTFFLQPHKNVTLEMKAPIGLEPELVPGPETEPEPEVEPEVEQPVPETEPEPEIENEAEPVQEETETFGDHEPMDLGSPLDSDPDFDLSGDLEEPDQQEELLLSAPATGANLDREGSAEREGGEAQVEEEEEEEEEAEKTEIGAAESEEDQSPSKKKLERLDSKFDSSYQPGAEELLYEGDPDNETEAKLEEPQEEAADESMEDSAPPTAATLTEGEEKTAQPDRGVQEGKGEGKKGKEEEKRQEAEREKEETAEKREEDEGFMVEVHLKDHGVGLDEPPLQPPSTKPSSSSSSAQEPGKKSTASDGGSAKPTKTTESNTDRFVIPLSFHRIHKPLPPSLPPSLPGETLLLMCWHGGAVVGALRCCHGNDLPAPTCPVVVVTHVFAIVVGYALTCTCKCE